MRSDKPYILVLDSGAYRHLIEEYIDPEGSESIIYYPTDNVQGIDISDWINQFVGERGMLPSAILSCPIFADLVLYGDKGKGDGLKSRGFDGSVFLMFNLEVENYRSLRLLSRDNTPFEVLSASSDLPLQQRRDTLSNFFTKTLPELLASSRAGSSSLSTRFSRGSDSTIQPESR